MSTTRRMPHEWKLSKLTDVADLQTGVAKNSKKTEDCVEVPYLRVANIQDGCLDLRDIQKIAIPEKKVDQYSLYENDLLLVEGNGNPANLGRCAIWDGSIRDCVHQNHLFVVRARGNVIDYRYLALQIQSAKGRYYLLSCSKSSSGLATSNSTQLKGFPLPIPPLPEQKAIADLLSTWDEAIEKTERLIRAKEKRFKWLLNDLIYVPTMNDRWKQHKTKSLFKERNESNRVDLPLLAITNGEGVIPREETGRKDTSNEDKSKYRRICPGDIGYNTMRMWQGVSALSTLEGVVSPAYTICIPGEKLYPLFVAYLFKVPFMIHRFYKYSQGLTSDTWNLKYHHFSEVRMPLPSLEEQEQIAETLSSAKQEIQLLKQLADKYKVQKRSLMQKMLTGEWRVRPDIVKQYEEA